MKFKYPSFVLVRSKDELKELVEWCEHIGYTVRWSSLSIRGNGFVVADGSEVYATKEFKYSSLEYTDCRANIQMFKALVAVNEENITEQYFVNTDGSLVKISEEDLVPADPSTVLSSQQIFKATREQIMEWFSDQFMTNDGDCQICRLKWAKQTRYVVTHPHGTVQLALYPKVEEFINLAYAIDMYVDENYRRHGVASTLLDVVERLTIKNGYKSLTVTYYTADSPRWVLNWYKRRGYKVISHLRNDWYSLEKKL